jgi:hypothetical protein
MWLGAAGTWLLAGACAHGQATYTASRAGDLQVGAGYTSANADYEYVSDRITGFAFYTDFDLADHFGVELSFHQLNDPKSAVYQRTYEFGGRYVFHFGRFAPYGKLMAGRGVLNYPDNDANLAYNILAGAGGVDVSVHPRIHLRAEFEYQDWLNTPGAGLAIHPTLLTIGVAYHFNGGRPR